MAVTLVLLPLLLPLLVVEGLGAGLVVLPLLLLLSLPLTLVLVLAVSAVLAGAVVASPLQMGHKRAE